MASPKRTLRRPRDPIQLAKLVGDIATGQAEDEADNATQRSNARSKKDSPRAKSGIDRNDQVGKAAGIAKIARLPRVSRSSPQSGESAA